MGLFERMRAAPRTESSGGYAAGLTVGQALSQARVLRNEVWGRPGRCPECGGIGYLDRIDLVDRIQEEHCVDCWYKWRVAEADTVQA